MTAAEVNYNRIHAERAVKEAGGISGKKCIVIGCNTGKDCSSFIEMGAREVHGVDIIDEIGGEYKDPHVTYFKMSAENMVDIKDDQYDLVYCFATMEHIPDIEAAFSEMVRVCRPGGILYCVSAPLWNSRNGHHKSNFFDSYPWIHLRMDEREIIAYCAAHGIADTTGNLPMSVHIAYMLDAAYFNKQPARKYVETCAKLNKMIIICNELEFDDKKILTPDIYQELRPKGYTSEELLAIVHTYIGRKNKGKHHFWLPVIPRLKRLLKKSVSLRKTVTTS